MHSIPPGILPQIVEKAILKHLPKKHRNEVAEQEEADKEKLQEIVDELSD